MAEIVGQLLNNDVALIAAAIAIIIISFMILSQNREITIGKLKIGSKPSEQQKEKTLEHIKGLIQEKHIKQIYNGWDSCEKDVIQLLHKSTVVKALNLKGRRWSKSPDFREAYQSRIQSQQVTQILFQHPQSIYVNEQVSKEFGWPSLDSYKEDMENSTQRFSDTIGEIASPLYQVRLFTAKPIVKLYVFDTEIFFSIYTGKKDNQYGETGPQVWRLERDSECGISILVEQIFNSAWDQAEPAKSQMETN